MNVDELMTEEKIKAGQTENQQEAGARFIFKISKVKHYNSPEQAEQEAHSSLNLPSS